MSDVAVRIAKELVSVSWSWKMADWIMVVDTLGLVEEESRGIRKTYVARSGDLWDVYFDNGHVAFVEVDFDVSENTDLLSDSEYDDKIDEYFERFEDAVNSASRVLGKPLFFDGEAAEGFPEDQHANWLALWVVGDNRIMLQQKHEERGLPFRNCFVVAPKS